MQKVVKQNCQISTKKRKKYIKRTFFLFNVFEATNTSLCLRFKFRKLQKPTNLLMLKLLNNMLYEKWERIYSTFKNMW